MAPSKKRKRKKEGKVLQGRMSVKGGGEKEVEEAKEKELELEVELGSSVGLLRDWDL